MSDDSTDDVLDSSLFNIEARADISVSAIGVTNFKSISAEAKVALGNITVLAGANSSGKSSFMQPFLLLKQTLDKPFEPDGLDISGPNACFSGTEQIFPTISEKKGFSITYYLETRGYICLSYAKRDVGGIYLQEILIGKGKTEHTLTVGTKFGLSDAAISFLRSEFRMEMFFKHFFKEVTGCIVNASRGIPTLRMVSKGFAGGMQLHFADAATKIAAGLIHVPGLRGNPARNYPTSSVSTRFPGLFTDYVASIVNKWKISKDKRLAKVGLHLCKLGLTWKVDTRSIDDTRVEVRVARLPTAKRGGAHDMVSIADVGFGVSQVLPVIVALLVATKGQMVYIEQPEIHLHPRAQVALAEILVEAASRGVKVVVETLSSHLVLALQTMVAEGDIQPDDLKLHWFTRGKTGMTEIKLAELGEDGSYGDWPEDFGDVELDLQQRYLDAATKRQAEQ